MLELIGVLVVAYGGFWLGAKYGSLTSLWTKAKEGARKLFAA